MLSDRAFVRRGSRDEAEKPFWISFSDLMTALMVLFLTAMSVALLAVTKRVSDEAREKEAREQSLRALLERIQQEAASYQGLTVDFDRHSINFGPRATFQFASDSLSEDGGALLREFVPRILRVAREDQSKRWLKRIIVEGFTDEKGSYLFNLDLSLRRSQRVLCALLSPTTSQTVELSTGDREMIRDLFLVGGYSFNSPRKTAEESRRIELRLEFFEVGEGPSDTREIVHGDFGSCAIK